MATGFIGRLFGYGAVGSAAYGVGYTHKSSEVFGDVADGISTVSHEAAEGIGALIGAARSGFNSSQVAARPPPPMVTHIYHDKDSGKSSIVTVLVVSGVGLTGYYAVCWWKGWDFFGLSQARTQQMFQALNDKFTQYSSHAKEELNRLRGMINASQQEQTRQAEVLDAVNDAVKHSGAALEGLDLKSADIAAELRRGAVSNEAMARSVMSLQFFMAAVAEGSVTDREQALAMLKQSFQEQAATLPSVQEQGKLEGAKHDSSWTFSSAVAAGKQMVSAPVTAIASYLWPCSSKAGGAQGRIAAGGAAGAACSSGTVISEVTGEDQTNGRVNATLRTDRAAPGGATNGDAAGGSMAGLGVRGWAARPDSGLAEVSEATGGRVAFGGGGVVRSSTRMPAAVSGMGGGQHGAGSMAGGAAMGGRVRFDSASDAMGEGRWEDLGASRQDDDGPAVRRTRPIFSSK